MEMLEPLYGEGGSDLVGIAVRPTDAGWCVGLVHRRKYGREAIHRAVAELVGQLDGLPGSVGTHGRSTSKAYGEWFRRGTRT
jgi:hypothetical protein